MRLLLLAVGVLAFIAVLYSTGAESATRRCTAGAARAFIAIQPDPPHLVGTIPSSFTDDARYFARRYNCRRASAQVRRAGLGVYEVRFPRLRPRLALATAISDEGVSASVTTGEDVVRVFLRGPLAGSDVATRRAVPFAVVVF